MKQSSSKEIMLVTLVVGLGVVMYVQYNRGAFSGSGGAGSAAIKVKEVKPADLPNVLDVSLDMGSGAKIRKNSRNLFNYAESPDEVAEKLRQKREADRLAKEAAARRQQQMEEEARQARLRAQQEAEHPPPPPPPPINFRLIGKMGEPRAPLAILADPTSGDIYTVREGEVIQDKFKVQKIEFDSVTIGYVNPTWAQETKTIRMGS